MHVPDHIHSLIDKYLAGTISEAEKAELSSWYRSFDDGETAVSDLPDVSEQDIDDRIKSRLAYTLQTSEQVQEPASKSVRRKLRLPAVAILLIMAMTAGFYYFMQEQQVQVVPISKAVQAAPTNDALPGGNKAILTLADGSSIILDSANNGVIGEQGNVQVNKLDNGLLAYEVNASAQQPISKSFYNTISTPRGGEYQVTLSDGTKVWLNAASSIRFPAVFDGTERSVEIKGEVYFEVAKNEQKPFRVKAGRSTVEVLGTHFNINAYEDETQIRTSLLEGSVRVSSDDAGEMQRVQELRPGQQARMNKSGRIQVVNNIDTEEVMAWKNGLFIFKSTDLRSIMRQVSRWYDVDIQYQGSVGMQFTGQITRNNNVSKIFEMLELTGEVRFKVQDKKVIVSR